MSGVFGVFSMDGSSVSAEALRSMQKAMAYWEADDTGLWHEGPIGLGHAMLWSTPESRSEHLPHVTGERGARLAVTADVRLDNRDELMRRLDLNDRATEIITDSELLLAAYRKWGEHSPEHLLGDFAYLIWDEARGRLFAARDHIGIKSLYYARRNAVLVLSNDIRCLLGHPEVPREVSDDSIALYVRDSSLWSPERTFFQHVSRLPSATTLIVGSKIEKSCYWRPEDSPLSVLGSEDEYRDTLRALLEDAVRVRLRSGFPVASHLSGGLDSSSISVLAARLLRDQDKRLLAFNWLHTPKEGENAQGPEWANARLVADAEGIEYELVDLQGPSIANMFSSLDLLAHESHYACYEVDVRRQAAARDVRVMLSGWGGDELISHYGTRANAEAFWGGAPLVALGQIRERTRTARRPVRSFLTRSYRELLQPLWSAMPMKPLEFLLFATDDLADRARRLGLQYRLRRSTKVRDLQLNFYYVGHLRDRIESWANAARRDRIEYRYPLLDKRIVELALGIPYDLYRRGATTRYLFRKAAADILPAPVLSNEEKDEPTRVLQLMRLYADGARLWRSSVRARGERVESCAQNPFISFEKVETAIDGLEGFSSPVSVEEAVRMEALSCAIFVIEAGRSLTVD